MSQKQRRGKRTIGVTRPGEDLFTQIQLDQEEARHGSRPNALQRSYDTSLGHLTRYGQTSTPSKSGPRPRWDEDTLAMAADLLRIYFLGTEIDELTEVEMTELENKLGKRVTEEVRRRFATACHLNRGIRETPGQAQSWFDETLAKTAEFHNARRAARKAEQEAAEVGNDTAQTEEPRTEVLAAV